VLTLRLLPRPHWTSTMNFCSSHVLWTSPSMIQAVFYYCPIYEFASMVLDESEKPGSEPHRSVKALETHQTRPRPVLIQASMHLGHTADRRCEARSKVTGRAGARKKRGANDAVRDTCGRCWGHSSDLPPITRRSEGDVDLPARVGPSDSGRRELMRPTTPGGKAVRE
jgi:hypothetical protein